MFKKIFKEIREIILVSLEGITLMAALLYTFAFINTGDVYYGVLTILSLLWNIKLNNIEKRGETGV